MISLTLGFLQWLLNLFNYKQKISDKNMNTQRSPKSLVVPLPLKQKMNNSPEHDPSADGDVDAEINSTPGCSPCCPSPADSEISTAECEISGVSVTSSPNSTSTAADRILDHTSSDSLIPPNVSLRYNSNSSATNFYGDSAEGKNPSVIITPRKVPCIVLSKQSESQSQSPTIFSPYISSPFFPLFAPTKIEENFAGKNSIVKKNFENEADSTKVKGKAENYKKLTFGMDRILSSDKDDKLPEESKTNTIAGDPDPDAEEEVVKSTTTNGFYQPSVSASGQSTSLHQHPHGQHGFSTQCTECALLSRYYYKFQFPTLQRSLNNYSQYSWLNSQSLSLFENQNSANGTSSFLHQNPAAAAAAAAVTLSTNFGYNGSAVGNYASVVSCNNMSGGGRRKRSWSRAVFSNLQRKGLEKRFQIQKYITKPDRRDLAAALGLSDAQVKVWFQNRRMKWRHTKDGKSGADEMNSYKNNEKKM